MPRVAVLVPMLGRPHAVEPLAQSLAESTDDARILWLVTDTDRDVLAATRGMDRVTFTPRERGDYAHKINVGYRETTEPYLFLAASDLHFHPGWLTVCFLKVKAGYQVVGTNDLGNKGTSRGTTSTHTLVARTYADRRGTIDKKRQILHEGYWHEWCDTEFVQTAKFRNAYGHARGAKVEHLHWLWGKRERDAVDSDWEKRMAQGEKLYHSRRRLWTV